MEAAVYMEMGSVYFYSVQSYMFALKLLGKNDILFHDHRSTLEAFPAISEALNFPIFPGKNSRFEPFS